MFFYSVQDGVANLQKCATSINSSSFSIKSVASKIQELAKIEIKKANTLAIEVYQGICELQVIEGELIRKVTAIEVNINNQAIIADYVRSSESSRDAALRILIDAFGGHKANSYTLRWEYPAKVEQELPYFMPIKTKGKLIKFNALKAHQD